MCVIHGGIILKVIVKKFRGKDQINRLRPGDEGMHKKTSETFFEAFSVELFFLSSHCVPCNISFNISGSIIEAFTCNKSYKRQSVIS